MFRNISNNIATYFYRKGNITQVEYNDVAFAIELVITHTVCFCSIMTLSLFFNRLVETVFFLLFFIVLRKENTGYHAKTFGVCFVVTNLIYIICTLLSPKLFNELLLFPILVTLFVDYYSWHKLKTNKNFISFVSGMIALVFFVLEIDISVIVLSTIWMVKLLDKIAYLQK